MLPSEISNGICSLNPHVDRLTISCIMEIDQQAEIRDYQICKSVINSNIKMTYEDVNQVLKKATTPPSYYPFEKNLLEMQELSNIITINKEKRGYLKFANTEVEIIEGKDGSVEKIQKKQTGLAEELIENFMVMANTCVATHLAWIDFIPTIYRNHGEPDFNKVNMTLDFIANLGYRLRTAKNATNALVLQKILHQLSNKEEFPILSTLILRSMQRAEYNTNNIGHFALELQYYTHFTSPIRRFPDLKIHQILKELTNPNLEFIDFNAMEKELQEICYHSSKKERQADISEEEAKKLIFMKYIEEHLEEYFEGFIVDINTKEIKVQAKNGLLGVASLSNLTPFKFNEKKKCLINDSKQIMLKIGHTVLLKAVGIDDENNKIIFSIEKNITLEEKKQQKLVKKIG